MTFNARPLWKLLLIFAFILSLTPRALAQERLCDSSFEDCRQPLWDLIDAETQQIDVAFWFMQDHSYADKIIARYRAGVRVRLIVDPRSNPTYAGNQQILDQFQAAGIPMRYKVDEGILHNKLMIFSGQGKIEFSGSNYNDAFVPYTPYTNYQDEVIYFTDDPSLVNSFKTKYDDLWTNTTLYGNYANVTGALTRSYPTTPIDPALNLPPSLDDSQDFNNRTTAHIYQENQKLDVIMYRITNQDFTNAVISAIGQGIPVRLMTEPDQYRDPSRLWHSWNVDRMYMAGVQIKQRKHLGLNHQKTVLLYGQGMTIFGSSNWTGPSSNYQQEHNYFTTKPWFFQYFVNEFERKWNSSAEMEPLVPLPPDAPVNPLPANGASGQAISVTLNWEGGYWAHKYDIYFGTTPTPPLIATNVETGTPGPDGPETFTVTGLTPGTTYYWRVVGKTMADLTASGPVWSFGTATAPPPSGAPTVTSLSPNSGTSSGGTRVTITGTGFAAGATVSFGNVRGTGVTVTNSTTISVNTPAHAAGAVTVVVTNSNGARGTLTNGYTFNGSATTPAPKVCLVSPESGALSGGTSVTISGSGFLAGATVSFGGTQATGVTVSNGGTTITATTPSHAAGAVNAVVTNPGNLSGSLVNAYTYAAPPPPPTITSISPNAGPTSGGTAVTITGTGFNYGATVTIGGNLATTITVVNSTTITARTLGHAAGAMNVVVTNYNGPSVTMANGFTYTSGSPTAPAISTIAPNTGPTGGGTAVTITGINFATGATVSFGGTPATGINVASSSSITATTPAHAAGAVNVVVTNPDTQTASLTNGFSYTAPPSAGEVVLYASEATTRVGNWTVVPDSTAAGGAHILNPDAGASKLANALANPTTYFEMTFNAAAGTPHRLWIRGRAQNDDPFNDSIFVQFSDSVNSGGGATSRIGTTASETINLEDCSGCGLNGWGWQDNGWGIGVMGPLIYFQTSGAHTIRIQPREDGLAIDQIVLSPQTYLSTSPGALKNDTTILSRSGGGTPPAPTITSVSPNTGATGGGTSVTITGTGFTTGATVGFGGAPATNINVTSGTSITATTPAHAAGMVNVVVTNSDNQSSTLTNGYQYLVTTSNPPSVTSVSPNSGTTSGGTVVTVNGGGFAQGATVSFGGTAATSVNVASGTSITATTPAHAAGAVNVVVTNPDSQSGTLTAGYTYTAPTPAPTITSVSPNTGTTGGGTSVTITGTGFASGATVSFGGSPATSVNVVGSASITATTPAHAAGAVNVVVTNPDNQSGTLSSGYTYNAPSTTLPSFSRVFVVVEENQSYSSVIGSASMPYLNTLAARYGLAANYFANTHPSIGNYFWLTTGQNITNDSNFTGTVTEDNIVRQLLAAGKTWKSYAESLPSIGYAGGDAYPYVKRHNPFAYISDVLDSPAQTDRLVPFSQFAADLAGNQLPHYSFIIPNQYNNAHDCPASDPSCTNAAKLAAADNWLKTNIDPLIASPTFQQDGLLIIVFDEAANTDTTNGGGKAAMLVISPKAKQNFQSTTLYQHESTLRLTAEGLGLTSFPGAAATASNMLEFFGGTNTAPIISGITPNSGPDSGGTAVTINGTGFVSGATVSFGGTQATSVNVLGSTTITATAPAHVAGALNVVVANPSGQSNTLTNGYTYTTSAPLETVLLADDFNNNSLDVAKWTANNLFSGFTDSTVVVSETNQQMEIGPLKQNTASSHYNGIKSKNSFNFSNAYIYVELVQAPASSTDADAMLTIGKDSNAYYRIYVEAGSLICQKNIGGTKTNLFTAPYDPATHRFWRIRHDQATGNVVFETATGSGGLPGAWTQRASQAWNTATVPLATVTFEIKGGTWKAEPTAPGKVIFDNFKAAKP
jgi:phosphatidylserine/phosphatidylglycerophosphate/cardiolipin synthase-like enzyme